MMQTNPPQKKIALVIGSGSVKCAAALGLQKVLMKNGIGIDMVIGCSGGAMYAAMIALGYDAETVQEMTLAMWTREVTGRNDRMALLRAALPKIFGFNEHFGLKEDALVMRGLQKAFGHHQFSDVKIPLFLAATDFYTGDQVVLSQGNLVDAIRASIAMPFTFKPWKVNGRLLIDGFMSDPMPVGIAIREGADVIVAMGFESPYQTRYNSAARFAFQMSSIMTNNLLRANFAFHSIAHHAEVIPVIPEFKERIRLFDTGKLPYIIEEGEKAMEVHLPYLQSLLQV